MNVSRPAAIPPQVPPIPHFPQAARATTARTPSTEAGDPTTSAQDSLWEVLTAEEREFFSQSEALGPLTYRRGSAPAAEPPMPTGRRVDVRG